MNFAREFPVKILAGFVILKSVKVPIIMERAGLL